MRSSVIFWQNSTTYVHVLLQNILIKDTEGSFVWHTTGRPVSFEAWAVNQPNGGEGENCVSMDLEHAYFFADSNCDKMK